MHVTPPLFFLQGITFDDATMHKYLTNPKKVCVVNAICCLRCGGSFHVPFLLLLSLFLQVIPGTKMVFAGLRKKGDRKNLIAFMKTFA